MDRRIDITRDFVERWAKCYDGDLGKKYLKPEQKLRDWLATLPNNKYLDREHFLKLAEWKSPRARRHYEKNADETIQEVTRQVYLEPDPERKVSLLRSTLLRPILHGVGYPIASAILHFFHPEDYPIVDFHVLRTLKRAGLWKGSEHVSSVGAYLEFRDIMLRLAKECGVSLRQLDKALWAFDKDQED